MGPNQSDHTTGPIAWRERGDGDPVIFLHGLGGTRKSWGPQLRELSTSLRCIAWDMPGYGASAPLEPLTYRGIADALVAWLDTLELDKADLVGLSFGGMHALHAAINHPDRVNRMVLADTSPAFGMDGTTEADWKRARLDPIERGGRPGDAADAIISSIIAIDLDPEIRRETIEAFRDISPRGFRAAVECLPSNDVRSELASIPHESLVIVGEFDRETPVDYAKVLADGLAGARLEIIPGAGHLTPAETPSAFNELVVDFLT